MFLISLLCIQGLLIAAWLWVVIGQKLVWRFEEWSEERRRGRSYLSAEAQYYVDQIASLHQTDERGEHVVYTSGVSDEDSDSEMNNPFLRAIAVGFFGMLGIICVLLAIIAMLVF